MLFVQSKKKPTKGNKKDPMPPLLALDDDLDEFKLLQDEEQLVEVNEILKYFGMDQKYVLKHEGNKKVD